MKHYCWGKNYCWPSVATLAAKLDCSRRQVIRYTIELREAGLIEVSRRQRSSAIYTLQAKMSLQEQKMSSQNVTSRTAYLFTERKPGDIERATRAREQAIASYFGETTIEGKRADPGVIKRVAQLVDVDHLPSYRNAVRAFCARSETKSWGILIRIAEDVALLRKPAGRVEQVSMERSGAR